MGDLEGGGDAMDEPMGDEGDLGDEPMDDEPLGDEPAPEGGGDAATSIVDATVAGLEQGLKAAGLLGDDDSLTTSSDEPGGEEPMDDMDEPMGDEEPMDDVGDEEPMDDMGDEELPPEEEDPEALEEQVLTKLARNVARRLLERRIKSN
jgi:hypothetical protein